MEVKKVRSEDTRDIVYGLVIVALEEGLPTDSWEEFSAALWDSVSRAESELLERDDWRKLARTAFEELRRNTDK